MWKKLGWVFVGIYTAVILYLNIVAIVKFNGFSWGAILALMLTLFPIGVIALELALKKMSKVVSILLAIPAFVVTLVLFLGSIAFNSLAIDSVAKAALLGITLVLLVFLAVKRLVKKKK
jgi:hypothetical protein